MIVSIKKVRDNCWTKSKGLSPRRQGGNARKRRIFLWPGLGMRRKQSQRTEGGRDLGGKEVEGKKGGRIRFQRK